MSGGLKIDGRSIVYGEMRTIYYGEATTVPVIAPCLYYYYIRFSFGTPSITVMIFVAPKKKISPAVAEMY